MSFCGNLLIPFHGRCFRLINQFEVVVVLLNTGCTLATATAINCFHGGFVPGTIRANVN